MPEDSLKEKTAKGLFWGGLSNGIFQLLNLVFGIFLARLLSPSEYGMVGMLTIFSLIASALQESGFTAALVNKRNIEHKDYNAVFWFSSLMGITLYLLLFVCSPLIASFYNEPTLTPLARFVFFSIVISSLGTGQSAYLFRNLMVKQRSLAQMIALAVSGVVGVILAWKGFSYWSIASQSLTYVSVNTLLLWTMSSFRPNFHINFAPLKGMISFSFRLLITNICQTINNNLLSVVLGKYFGKQDVGFFNNANKWCSMGYSTILGMINGVAQPTLHGVIDNPERQVRVFRKMLRFAAFVSFPALLGLALVAPELILITIGEKWMPSANLMQILCIGGAFMSVQNLYGNLIISKGRSDLYLYATVGLGVFQIVLALLLHSFGIKVMVSAYVALNILWLLVWHMMTNRCISLSIWSVLKDLLPYLAISIGVMLITGYSVSAVSNIYLKMIGKIVIAVLLYVGVMYLSGAATFKESVGYLLKRNKKD